MSVSMKVLISDRRVSRGAGRRKNGVVVVIF
jgi:hypothetical protein